MKKLSMLGIIGGAALLAAVPFSLQWSQMNMGSPVPVLTLSQAEAQTAGMERRQARRTARQAGRETRRAYRRSGRYAAAGSGPAAASYGAAGSGYRVVHYDRSCAIYPSGFRWCWTQP